MPDTQPPDNSIRLHRRIAQAGLCSRRAAEEWIRDGRVMVNGESVTEMGVKVGPDDVIEVDGRPLTEPRIAVILMNKPKGYVTTMDDPRGRPTVRNLLPPSSRNLKPVGRLDMDTDGVLLFTNDGELAHRLAHPRYVIDKEYEAIIEGQPDDNLLDKLRRGIKLEDGMTAPATITVMSSNEDSTRLTLVIHEGRNRQVKRMFEEIGHPVRSLSRIRVAFLTARKLPKSACRLLGQAEVQRLRQAVGLN